MNNTLTYGDKSWAWARLPLVALVTLSMLLSCSVKESIQIVLEAPITKPLNPNKTNLSEQHESCPTQVQQEQYIHHQVVQAQPQAPQAILVEGQLEIADQVLTKSNRANAPPSVQVLDTTPLYILYGNLKLLS